MYLNGSRSGLLNSNSISTWTQISGPSAFIHSPNSLTSSVSGFGAGLHTFKLSIKCKDGLYAEDTVSISVLPLTRANAGRDSFYCPTGILNLNANSVSSTETGLWSIITSNNAGVTIQSPSNPTSPFTLNPNMSGVSILRWTITNINGCISYDDVVISNCGGVTPVNAGNDQILGNCFSSSTCTNLTAMNGGTGIGGQRGIWSLVSGPNIPSFSIINSPTTKVCN